MAQKTVYLFGAGASCECLPIVKDIPDRMEKLIETLEDSQFAFPVGTAIPGIPIEISDEQGMLLTIIENLKDLLALSRRHASIDTAAKKLFIKGDETKLKKLKLGLSVFLICEQILNQADDRYDTFFAAIMGGSTSDLPKHVRVVSWNYDFQFELAFMEYTGDFSLNACRTYLKGMAKYESGRNNDDIHSFGIFKLNGEPTNFLKTGYMGTNYVDNFSGPLDQLKLESIIKNYATGLYRSDIKSGISFAWESHRTEVNVIDTAINNVVDAEVLVVIGYSFPFFNRDVDREIIKRMEKLKTVYFQSPEANNLIERFHAILDQGRQVKLVPITDTKQFYLPNEI